jgi:hypothetical protein
MRKRTSWELTRLWRVLGLRTLGARGVEDDLGKAVLVGGWVEFVLDGGEGAQKLVGDVSENGGTARGYAVLRKLEEETGEEVIDGDGGLEFGEIGGEDGGQIRSFALVLGKLGVAGTEEGVHFRDQ